MKQVLTLLFVVTLAATSIAATANVQKSIPEGSRVYIGPMGGFETNLIAALNNKKVPVVVVGSRSTADFEVGGGSQTQQANWMRIWVSGTWRTDEKASIVVKNLHTDVIVYAYEVNKWAAWHGSQSAAEACAKHMKSSIVRVRPEELAAFGASPRAKSDTPVTDPVTTPSGSTKDMFISALGLSVRERGGRGAEITDIARNGSAEVSGFHVGEVINSVDGKNVKTPAELGSLVSNHAPGSQVRLGYTFRNSLSEFQTDKVITVRDHLTKD